MIELAPTQRLALRARAHSLRPVVSIGQNGLSDSVLGEIERGLTAHELIKIRIFGADRGARESLIREVCEKSGASPVQHIGNILLVYREKPAKKKPAKAPRPATTTSAARTDPKSQARFALPGEPTAARRRLKK